MTNRRWAPRSARACSLAPRRRWRPPPAALTTNVNCDIIVPANPLSARGLATPYQLAGTDGLTPTESGCRMSNAAKLGAFVQATILDPATGRLSVYDPLVVTQGTRPAVRPTIPLIPANAIVTIDFAFNGKDLFPVGATPATLAEADCVSGQPGSVFGQLSFCNGINFFSAVLTNPVTVTRNGAGVAITGTFTTEPQQAAAAVGTS